MKYLDLTLPTPQHNLACDEALLDLCEEMSEHELLRFWEPQEYFVVLGYSNKINSNVNLFRCQKTRTPVLRRCTGGGTVVQGPGCLNYSLILKIPDSGPLRSITGTNSFVLQCHRAALEPVIGQHIEIQGSSDLTLGRFKFSGNAQRRRGRSVLVHGTFLLHLDLALIEELLPLPSKQPPYRQNRSHKDFLANLYLPSQAIKDALRNSWQATDGLQEVPFKRIDRLVQKQYTRDEWSHKF